MLSIIATLIYQISSAILNPFFHFVSWVLTNLILAPAQLPQSLHQIYDKVANVSVTFVTVGSIWAFIKLSGSGLTAYNDDSVQDIVGRAFIAIVMGYFGWYVFMDVLVPLNNMIVSAIIGEFNNISPSTAGAWTLPTVLVVTASNLGPLMGLVVFAVVFLIAVIIAIVVWLRRNGELAGMIVLTPVAFMLPVFNKRMVSISWLIQEMGSVIFSQSIMALFVYLGFFVMTGGGNQAGTDIWNPNIFDSPDMAIINFATGVVILFLSTKAHTYLRGMINGYQVTSDHSALAAGMGMFVGKSLGANVVPPGMQLAAKQFAGELGFGEFSKAGRALQVANEANRVLGRMESQGIINQIGEAQALSEKAMAQNPYTAQARVGSAIANEIAINQNPSYLAAKGLTRSATTDFTRAARNISTVDTKILDNAFQNVSDTYRSFGYGREYETNQTNNSTEASSSTSTSPVLRSSSIPNPYIKK
ncbi:hypothetical protein Desaci_4786 (plasmid) [Desulfosporosinus acidiphilus SJ4]|uniref:Uncharacterized protein n=1 Tax=Desulfosporosinus acidiphilus (strain DSM 22704 / JCM 16185 / SJ4) TaxID=646529 RepID=I4DCT6_DESAJ|nr:hypothetical protein [Desulfosporosinus acidiphilus]AFM43610.1 hypothetical protein Desaci_4786 [Desulfosporosinus acidiphilus SJ4]